MAGEKPKLWCVHIKVNGQRVDDLNIMGPENEDEIMAMIAPQALRLMLQGFHLEVEYMHTLDYEEPPMLDMIIIQSLIAFLQFKGALFYIYEQVKKGQEP
jgi:hypothetical protein